MNDAAPATATTAPPHPRRRRRALRRILLALAAAPLVLVAFLLIPPLTPAPREMLYLAIPRDAQIAADAENVFAEVDARTADPKIVELLLRLGLLEDPEDLREPGFLTTLFFFTGKHTVGGATLPPTITPPTPFAQPYVDYGAVRLYGATTVGWRYRLLRLADTLGWIPGVGTLERDPSTGAQILRFNYPDPLLEELGLVLSLDLRDGILYACLSRDPGGVRELVRRVEEADTTRLAPVFGPRMVPRDLLPPADGSAPSRWRRRPRVLSPFPGLWARLRQAVSRLARSRTFLMRDS